MSDQVPANVLEESSRQMDQHKKRLGFRTLIGNSEVSWLLSEDTEAVPVSDLLNS